MKDESMSYLDALKEIKRLKEVLNKIRAEIENENCISRQVVLSYISNELGFGNEENGYDLERKIAQKEIYNFIKKMPSVAPMKKTEWIPVSERLPEEETDVLVCCETGAITVCCGSYSTEVSDTFIWYTGGWRYGKVVAWMPLPEPYKEET